jgi:hypothetical protein
MYLTSRKRRGPGYRVPDQANPANNAGTGRKVGYDDRRVPHRTEEILAAAPLALWRDTHAGAPLDRVYALAAVSPGGWVLVLIAGRSIAYL